MFVMMMIFSTSIAAYCIIYFTIFLKSLMNNTFFSNSVYGHGGGLAIYGSGEIVGNLFLGNSAGAGSGLYVSGESTLINNVIAENRSSYSDGSGLYLRRSSHRLLHNTIARNTGNGVYLDDSTVWLSNTVLVSQTVGISVTPGSTATLNATMWGSGTWANTTDWGGAGTIITGTVNVWGNPAFAAPDAGDYHITPDSAATDAGVDAGVATDVDGEPRPTGTGYDIGADELYYPALKVTKHAFPNPVQAGERLTYTIRVTNTGNVTLTATVTDVLPDHVTPGETPGGSLILPGGTITWTPVIVTPGDVWTETVVVTVEVDCAGPLTNVVQVSSVEDASGVYTNIVTLPPTFGVEFVPDHAGSADPGTIITYTHTLTNTGNRSDTLALTHHSSQGWVLTYTTPVSVRDGQSATVVVSVTVPAGAISGSVDTSTITASSQSSPTVRAAVTDTSTVNHILGVELAPMRTGTAHPGDIITYIHTLTNTGNGPDVFDLETASSEGWPVVLLGGAYPTGTLLLPLPLDAGATTILQVRLTVPSSVADYTTDETIITATSQTSSTVQAVITDATTAVNYSAGVELAPAYVGSGDPGSVVIYTHTLTNSGNVSDTFDITHYNSLGWLTTYDTPVSAGQGQTATVLVNIVIPADSISGTRESTAIMATLRAVTDTYAVITDSTVVNHVPGVTLSPDCSATINPNNIITYTHILTNTGNGPDSFDLTHESKQGWAIEYVAPISVGHNQTSTVFVSITVPAGSSGLTDTTIITATSQANINARAAVTDLTIVNAAPVADAGFDQSAIPDAIVLLDGSGSIDPDGHLPLTYHWQQIEGPFAVLVGADKAQATFQAPPYQSMLTFTLAVTDTLGLGSAPDTIVVYVKMGGDGHHVYLPLVVRSQ